MYIFETAADKTILRQGSVLLFMWNSSILKYTYFLKPLGPFNSGERYVVVFNMSPAFKYKNEASGEFIHCAFCDHGAFLKTLK